jgi:hypothetical protein
MNSKTDWNQVLLKAASEGDLNKTKEALSNGADINVGNLNH